VAAAQYEAENDLAGQLVKNKKIWRKLGCNVCRLSVQPVFICRRRKRLLRRLKINLLSSTTLSKLEEIREAH
jgi:hypothetical protein